MRNNKPFAVGCLLFGIVIIISTLMSGCAHMIAPSYHQEWVLPAGVTQDKLANDMTRCSQLADTIDPRAGGNAPAYSRRCMILEGYTFKTVYDQ